MFACACACAHPSASEMANTAEDLARSDIGGVSLKAFGVWNSEWGARRTFPNARPNSTGTIAQSRGAGQGVDISAPTPDPCSGTEPFRPVALAAPLVRT